MMILWRFHAESAEGMHAEGAKEFHAMNAMNFREHLPPNEHILCGYFLCGLCERNNFHAKNAKGKSGEER